MDPPPRRSARPGKAARPNPAGGGAFAVSGDRIVAAVLWGERGGGLYVGRLSVNPSTRRSGLVQVLLGLVEDAAGRIGLPDRDIGVRIVLFGNRALFASLGLRETVLHTHDGYEAPTWVAMEQQLY